MYCIDRIMRTAYFSVRRKKNNKIVLREKIKSHLLLLIDKCIKIRAYFGAYSLYVLVLLLLVMMIMTMYSATFKDIYIIQYTIYAFYPHIRFKSNYENAKVNSYIIIT